MHVVELILYRRRLVRLRHIARHRRNLAAGLTYWFDRYRVSDFALGSQIEDRIALPGIVLLGYGYRPYTINSVWGRILYVF